MYSCVAVTVLLALSTLPGVASQPGQVELDLLQSAATARRNGTNTYIVAEGSTLTFKCLAGGSYLSHVHLHWNFVIGNVSYPSTTNDRLAQLSERFTKPSLQTGKVNPAYITVGDLRQSGSNSTVGCEVPPQHNGTAGVHSRTVRLLIEAHPTCPRSIRIAEDSLNSNVLVQWDMYQGHLAATYNVSILASGTTLVSHTVEWPSYSVSRASLLSKLNASTGTGMAFNLTALVAICTAFGCADNCTSSSYVIQSETDATRDTLPTSPTTTFTLSPAVTAAVASIGVLAVVALLAVLLAGCILYRRHKLYRRHRTAKPASTAVVEVIEGGNTTDSRFLSQEPQYASVAASCNTLSSAGCQHYTISQNCNNSNDNLYATCNAGCVAGQGAAHYENSAMTWTTRGSVGVTDSTSSKSDRPHAESSPAGDGHHIYACIEDTVVKAEGGGGGKDEHRVRKSPSPLDASMRVHSTSVLPLMNGALYASLKPFTLDTA